MDDGGGGGGGSGRGRGGSAGGCRRSVGCPWLEVRGIMVRDWFGDNLQQPFVF